jgi:uncharacterized membrane protein YhhN
VSQRTRSDWRLAGWIAFLLCAIAFLAIGIRDADALGILASALFILGVLFFLVPFLTDEE